MLNDSLQAAGEAERHQIQTTPPECLRSIIGKTCKFQIKITEYNFTARRQTFTVSRIIADESALEEPALSDPGVAVVPAATIPQTAASSSKDPTAIVSEAAAVALEVDPESMIGKSHSPKETAAAEGEEFGGRKKEKRPRLDN